MIALVTHDPYFSLVNTSVKNLNSWVKRSYTSETQSGRFAINEEGSSNVTRPKRWVSIGVTLAIVVVFIGLLLATMPKGFKMTHEQIGTGKPALVFVYDPHLVVTVNQAEQMNEARDLLGDQVYFLVAKIGSPEGEKLIAEHRATPTELLLFDGSGSLIKRQFALKSSSELIQWITEGSP